MTESTCRPSTRDLPTEKLEKSSLPICPLCGGVLLLLRNLFRCPRCQYSVCEDCEGGTK